MRNSGIIDYREGSAIGMYETFENLAESKKEHILQVCIEEFARNGYQNTSTNTIVKRLGISKGVLFLYFKSKKNLFLYITDYLMESLTAEFFKRFSTDQQVEFIDIFDLMGELYHMLLREKPHVAMIFMEAVLNTPAELREEVEARHELIHEKVWEKIKINNVRKDVDIQKVMDIMHMVSYYVGRMIFREYGRETEHFKADADRYIKAFNEYIDIIKYGVCE
ncbi:MAG: TetR/AcrR family transcriptional regulator [Clostridiaceae bacterium]|nr:TetR/AcrR family transcriptional regulator [Clostridiaceae bacterium]